MFTIIKLFWKEHVSSAPSRDFRVRLWQRLEAELPTQTHQEHLRDLFRRMAIGFVIALPILFGTTSVYAYSSSSIAEGNVLYPVKRGMEMVQLRLLRSPQETASYRLELYERRLDEAEYLLETRALMIHALNAAVEEDEYLESVQKQQILQAEMLERLRNFQGRYETVRARVYIDEPNGIPSLRDPSFMIIRTQD